MAARTSSFHFKGHTGDISEIGRQLNVATILEGSVRRAGDKVRVTVQLINVADGFHLWSETYDRKLDDVFAIQEDIAQQVVGALEVTLLGEEQARLAKRPTENLEAYDAYLLGQQRMARLRRDSLAEAVEYFQKAIDLDPDYALAYVGLADAHLLLIDGNNVQTSEAVARAKPLIDKAFELDSQLGEAYASLGLLEGSSGDYEAAKNAYRRSIELNTGYADAYMRYGRLLGDTDPAQQMELFQKALELDPLSPMVNFSVAEALVEAGRLDESLERYRRVIEIDRGFAQAYRGIAKIYMDHLDQPEEAVVWLEKGGEVAPDDLLWDLSVVYMTLGRFDDDIAWWRRAIDRHPDDPMNYYGLAGCYFYSGRPHEAIEILRRRIETAPESWQAYVALHDFHVLLGQVEQGIRLIYEGSKRAAPAFAQQFLAQDYLILDDEPSAKRAWERMLVAWPDYPRPPLPTSCGSTRTYWK